MCHSVITNSLIRSWFSLKEAQKTPHISGGFLVRVPRLNTITATRWELVNKIKCKFNVGEKNKKKYQRQCTEETKQYQYKNPLSRTITKCGINKLEIIKGLFTRFISGLRSKYIVSMSSVNMDN